MDTTRTPEARERSLSKRDARRRKYQPIELDVEKLLRDLAVAR